MGERDELLAAIRVRLDRVAATRSVEPVLEPEVRAQARRLAEFAASQPDELEAAHLGGWLHWIRYQGTADAADLNTAIDAFTGCFIAGWEDVPADLSPVLARRAVPAAQGGLGELLCGRADQDAVGAITLLWERIVAAIPADDPDRPAHLSNLGVALLGWFGHTRNRAHLDAAVEQSRTAVTAARSGCRDWARVLANLGHALQVRAGATGSAADLDEAIEAERAALAAVPAADQLRPSILANLGRALLARFEQAGRLTDLDAAIESARTAIGSALSRPADRTASLCVLGSALMARYEQSGRQADLEAAVDAGQAALDATPAGHQDRPLRLSSLGTALQYRFRQAGDPADLDRAAELKQASVAQTPAGHPRRPWLLDELGTVRLERFRHRHAPGDLDAAIGYAEAAVGLGPSGHPAQAIYLANLGIARYHRAQITGLTADQEATWSAFAQAEAVESATPSLRMRMAAAGAWLAARTELSRAADLMERAVLLLPETAPVQLARSDQQYMVGSVASLASEAAALALASGGPGDERAIRALRLLETGRAVLLSQALGTRSDLTDLRRRDPGLARRFTELRDLLDQSDRALPDRAGLASEFDATRARIRALDGFATFGLPPSAEDLRSEAAQGPVVLFSTGTFRCDALLLTRSRITAIDLPGLTRDALVSQVLTFQEAVRATTDPATTEAGRDDAQAAMSQVLAWLWDTAAGPVLAALGYDREPLAGQQWPRVWWAPGGLLGLLPLHAAGHHQAGPGREAVMDRVVSSYTPTVRALRYARQRAGARAGTPDRSLIVAVPAGVHAEVSQVRAMLPDPVVLSEPGPGNPAGHLPTKANVLARLPDCAIAHFACHGATDPADPAQSRLLLRDHATDPFTVTCLGLVDLGRARLAYLSACQRAASVPAGRLTGESIHLTTAFQLAGFPSVVGALWDTTGWDVTGRDIIDGEVTEPAASMAAAFYAGLRTAQGALDPGRAATALHHAIRDRRDRYPARPFLWAGYLHCGA